jgi:hypothetical protein
MTESDLAADLAQFAALADRVRARLALTAGRLFVPSEDLAADDLAAVLADLTGDRAGKEGAPR